jgi:two-component system C4-dicarboxylate transport sensor histidine kinase DctB
VERAAALFENRIAESGIRLKIGPYSCATYVQADPNRLEQVFINLLSNALDAVEGQADAVVTVRVASAKGMQRILIADNGPGIPPSQQDHLFDPFYTTKPPGAGLGLGLTIAFNIIQDFKGRLTIRNRRNGGAAAIVSLRIAPPAEAGGTRGDI